MNKDKQIEEMYKDVYDGINHNAVIDITHGGYIGINTDGLTRELYDDGYRKASDVAEEIFAEIERMVALNSYQGDVFTGRFLSIELEDDIVELKKKYTEGEG